MFKSSSGQTIVNHVDYAKNVPANTGSGQWTCEIKYCSGTYGWMDSIFISDIVRLIRLSG